MKTLKKLGTDGELPQLDIYDMCSRPTGNIKHNGERVKAVSLRPETKRDIHSHCSYSAYCWEFWPIQ